MFEKTRLKRGELLQAELHSFFASLSREPPGKGKALPYGALTEVKGALDRLIADGWSLQVSARHSPADSSGVDFIWSHATKGWFALDAKAVGQTSSGLIHLVVVANNMAAGECQRLCFENKKGFVELLVALSTSGQAIDHAVLAAPKVATMSREQLFEELKSFRGALNRAAIKTRDGRYAAWANNLGKAIGYCVAEKRAPAQDAAKAGLIQGMATAALNEFLQAFFNPRSQVLEQCMRQQVSLNRSQSLQYLICDDQLKVRAGSPQRLVVLSGLGRLVRQAYQEMYCRQLAQHSTAEWLLLRRRVFEAKGVDCAIHYILDSLQRKPEALMRAA